MLAFVTSLRARALAADWDHHVRLLERTLASFLAQTDPEIRVVVVCHDLPHVSQAGDPRVHFQRTDLPLPARDHADMVRDKVLKISIGAQWAIDHGCRFLMYADADDLVSRRLAATTRQHPDANGWYFPDGFSHRYGQPWLTRSQRHDQLCGTCAIVRTDLLRFERSADYRGGWVNSLAAAGHQDYRAMLDREGHALAPLPFPGSVYLQHADSLATLASPAAVDEGSLVRHSLRAVRCRLRQWSRRRPLTPALAREFTIPWRKA